MLLDNGDAFDTRTRAAGAFVVCHVGGGARASEFPMSELECARFTLIKMRAHQRTHAQTPARVGQAWIGSVTDPLAAHASSAAF